MNRETRKAQGTPFLAMQFQLQSSTERDEWLKSFPAPLPRHYALTYTWRDDNVLELCVIPTGEQPPAEAAAADELEKLELPDLKAKAAELGVKVYPKASKKQIATQIAEKLAAVTP
jgi:hypothetical protein